MIFLCISNGMNIMKCIQIHSHCISDQLLLESNESRIVAHLY